MFSLDEIRYLIDPALYDELKQPITEDDDSPARYTQFQTIAAQQVRAACAHTTATLALSENAEIRQEIMPAFAWIVELLSQPLLQGRDTSYTDTVQRNYKNALAILGQITAPDIVVDSDSAVKSGEIKKVNRW